MVLKSLLYIYLLRWRDKYLKIIQIYCQKKYKIAFSLFVLKQNYLLPTNFVFLAQTWTPWSPRRVHRSAFSSRVVCLRRGAGQTANGREREPSQPASMYPRRPVHIWLALASGSRRPALLPDCRSRRCCLKGHTERRNCATDITTIDRYIDLCAVNNNNNSALARSAPRLSKEIYLDGRNSRRSPNIYVGQTDM